MALLDYKNLPQIIGTKAKSPNSNVSFPSNTLQKGMVEPYRPVSSTNNPAPITSGANSTPIKSPTVTNQTVPTNNQSAMSQLEQIKSSLLGIQQQVKGMETSTPTTPTPTPGTMTGGTYQPYQPTNQMYGQLRLVS